MEEGRLQDVEFFFRRLAEPPEVFGYAVSVHPLWWLAIAIPVLLAALGWAYYVYVRDSQSVGWFWGGILASVRTLTFLAIFFVWLLPATRVVETTEQRSRVVLLFDVSGSVSQTSDAPPSDAPGAARPTRQDHVLALLLDAPGATASEASPRLASSNGPPTTTPGGAQPTFLDKLLANNPLYCYRFGEMLDPNPWRVTRDSALAFHAWSRKLQPELLPTLAECLPEGEAAAWVKAADRWQQLQSMELNDQERHERDVKALAADLEAGLVDQQRLRARLLHRTNVGGALVELLRKESGNMVQGVVLFSDGRKNAGSDQEVDEAVKLAKINRIPIFTVGVGEHHETPNLRLVDVLAPGRVQPEDEFPVRVAVEGENLKGQSEVDVILTIEKPGQPKEEQAQKAPLNQGAGRLATASAEFRVANPEKIKGDWKFSARVLPVAGERTRADNRSEETAVVKVEDRKLAVLLASSGAGREYQFLRNLLVREQDKFDLSIYLQSAVSGSVQDVDPKRLLEEFPTELRARDEDPNNLGNYDVVIALDLDWTLVPGPRGDGGARASPQENLKRWVEELAGGLIVAAFPVNTFALAREKNLEIIRDLYPVVLDDTASSFTILERPSAEPWALNWGPSAVQQPYLDLTDAGDKSKVLEGWEEFFETARNPETGEAEGPAKRGFFSFFPLKDAKPAATVLARFGDSDRQYLTPRGQRQPFFVVQTVGKGPVFYLGSPETYRLRTFSEKYHERFWTKLIRQMGKGDQGRGTRRGLLLVGSRHVEGGTVEVEAQLYDAEMKPLQLDDRTKLRLKVIPPDGMMDAPKEWADGLEMIPDPARPGWFQVRFPVRRVGRYGLEVRIPGSIETLVGKFRVERTDPERDETRPDFTLLHRLASDAKDVRLSDERLRPELLAALAQTRANAIQLTRSSIAGGKMADWPEGDRLFFDVDSARFIPDCLHEERVPYRTEGRVTDLWDKGWTLVADPAHPERASGPPWALVLIGSLFCAEWLTRKLIKLA